MSINYVNRSQRANHYTTPPPFLWAGASNDSGVVDDGNFWRFMWLLSRKLLR